MSYEIAVKKAWEDLLKISPASCLKVKFLGQEYQLDPGEQKIFSPADNKIAKEYITILILHYLAKKLQGLPCLTGEWSAFKEFAGIEGYYPVFQKRAIGPIVNKYGSQPQDLLKAIDKLPAKKSNSGDISLEIEIFEKVPLLVILWAGDSEFSAEANILFDKNITQIFCVEDIIVLAEIVARSI